ncbi:hypothetical protein A3Q56_00047 [Intoshia linei]|uniref:Uncharacterized protein n=1 Tax=Intoshia linei TaxID=1819745 RepID=A0A177BCY9_9BILA|nr:hypothetical protein A3Q56_00047 [Intoshia linei]
MNLESAPDNSTQITNITEDPGIALVQEKESEIKTNLRKIQNDKIQHKIFLALQIMTAIFASFAHGANDISNSISPLASIWEVLSTNTNTLQAKHQTPIWILFYGSIGVALGLWIFGARVIETVGKKITNITTESGFCIEIGSAITVLVASNIGLPISSTHCKVGSIVAISKFTADKRIKWKLFTKILFGWFLTLPVTVLLSAGIMCIFKYTIL